MKERKRSSGKATNTDHMYCIRILFLLLLCTPAFLHAQKKAVLAENRITLNYPDHVITAGVSPKKKRHLSDRYFYYWFRAGQIKQTRGSFEGKLLHGIYTDFYPDKNLREKGRFRYGLKQGEWRTWYPGGELKEVVHYKNGVRDGKFFLYTEKGILQRSGHLRNDQLHGKVLTYSADSIQTEQYIRGEKQADKPAGKLKKAEPSRKDPKNPDIRIRKGWKILPLNPGKST